MSYIVLARKYRPQNFDEVYAQEHITTILKNAITFNRIAHAFLFTGSRGVGKTSLARILAKSLNCMEGLSANPCNKCENCVEITQGSSTDVVEIDGASNTGVEDIRDLQKELMYATSKSRYKIFIIDEVHMLSKNAFNALLKTLEEPPEQVVFIFATTEPHKVLPTIISRCQRYDFKRIPMDAIVSCLKRICEAESIIVENEALYQVAKKAEGSMRDALSLMDQLIALGKQEMKTNDVLELFGIVSTDVYHKITEYICEKKSAPIIGLIHNILDKGNDLQEFLNGYLDYIRTLLLIKTNVPLSELPDSLKEEMKKINENFTEETLLYILSILIKTKTEIRLSGNPVLIAEMTFIKLTKIEEMKSVAEIVSDLLNSEFSSSPVIRQQPSKSIPGSSSQKPLQEISKKESKPDLPNFSELNEEVFRETKDKLCSYLESYFPLAASYFSELSVLRIQNNAISFKTNSESAYNYLEKNREKLAECISKFYRLKIKLLFTLEKDETEDDRDVMKNPTLEELRKESPELAKFIEQTDSTIRPLYNYKPPQTESEPDD